MLRVVFKGVFGGMCIGIAGTVYLKVGAVAGAVLFAFGLIAVVSLQFWLFTGKAWTVWRRGYGPLLFMLAMNLLGCLAVAALTASPDIAAAAESIITARLEQGWLRCGLLAVGCGFIMTTAVTTAAKGNWWPLLFGVPAFILCGFPHCIADAFYIECCRAGYLAANIGALIPFYAAIVVGNFLGCNLYRLADRRNTSSPAWLRHISGDYD